MFKVQTQKRKNKIVRRVFLLLILLVVLSFLILYKNFDTFTNRNSIISPLAETASQNANLEKLLLKANVPFAKIQVATDSSILIYLKDGQVVNLSERKNLESQISSLQLILSRLTIEGKKFKFLDLRFEKPVIVF